MYVNQYELSNETVKYSDEINEVLFAGLTIEEVFEMEAYFLDW